MKKTIYWCDQKWFVNYQKMDAITSQTKMIFHQLTETCNILNFERIEKCITFITVCVYVFFFCVCKHDFD